MTAQTTPDAAPGTSSTRPGGRRRRPPRRSRELVVLLAVLVLLVVVAVFPAAFAPYDPLELAGPSLSPPDATHLLGTDEVGRDLLSRIIHGLQISLLAGAVAIGVALGAGLVVGVLSGLRPGGILDRVLGVVSESVLAVPAILLSLAVITAFGRGALVAGVAVGIAEAPGFARLIRGLVIQARTLTYVEAAVGLGTGPLRVITRHIVPRIAPPLAAYTALNVALALLAIGSLSYLGFGEAPPSPEWGVLISEGQRLLVHSWWVALLPGLALAATAVLLSRISHLLQEDA
ncbi:ABC transporter permease [Georgenia sp. Z1344]|uniref:ABC transporter permease n=1 Tax=Georgenia sp. Z1344 TaxID=3416706 RepID=UPI003CE93671